MKEEELRKKTVAELKALLTEKSLNTAGKKEELVARLLEAAGAVNTANSADAEPRGAVAGEKRKANDAAPAKTPDAATRATTGTKTTAKPAASPKKGRPAADADAHAADTPKRGPDAHAGRPGPVKRANEAPKKAGHPTQHGDANHRQRFDPRAKRFNHPNRDALQHDNKRRHVRKAGDSKPRDVEQRPPLTPEEKAKKRLERLIRGKGVEAGVPLDEAERLRRQKRLERFGGN